jgi:MYXO-CTERM domain-containing protein
MRRTIARSAILAVALGALGVAVTVRPVAAAAAPQPPASLAKDPPHLPGAPACRPSLASPDEPQTGRNDDPQSNGARQPAPLYFAPDFPVFADSDYNPTLGAVGGFGGIRFRAPLHHTPVIFVHGNQADAQNWLDPMLQFAESAGYTMQEMYALSYNGLANYYAGAPTQMNPSSLDRDYVEQNPLTLSNGGHGAADDDNVPDLCRFVEAVQWYTGSPQVDIVSHSLGVTLVRRTMELYPALARDVVAFLGIAGANHGTTVCRELSSTYYGCDEIAPGTAWLAQLNARGETYGPTQWMTIYDGAEGDPFYVGPDVSSPHLAGADNRTFNTAGVRGDYHNDLRVDPPEVDTYLAFLLRHGQAGPGAATGVDALAAQLEQKGAQMEARNQLEPSVYRLDSAALCIPRLTGRQDGCSLPVASSGTGRSGSVGTVPSRSGVPGAGALPNTSAPGGDGAPAWLLAIAAALAVALRRRQRMPVS